MNIVAQGCGIVIMLVILYFIMSQKKLKLHTLNAFMVLWASVFFALIFDISSIIAIHYRHVLPEIVVNAICKMYLFTLTWESMSAFWYVYVDISKSEEKEKKWGKALCIEAFICDTIIAILPIGVFQEGRAVYTFGPAVLMTYAVAVLQMTADVLFMNRHKREMNPRRRRGVFAWFTVWAGGATIQFFYNELLIVGFSGVVGILIIYLMLENPMANIDRDTGLFTLNALFEYMRQKMARGKDVSVLCVRYDSNRNSGFSYETESGIAHEVASFISAIPKAIVFRSSSSEFVLVFEKKKYSSDAIRYIEERFSKPWGSDNVRMLPLEMYCMESTKDMHVPTDLLTIFQYAKQNHVDVSSSECIMLDATVIERIYEEKSIENEIIDALRENRVEVFYQPIYGTKQKRFTSAEALVRIRDRNGDIVPPGKFIPIAEKRGLIIRLGERVFENVCKFIVENKLEDMGLEYIEINLSVIQCAYENLADDFIKIMQDYQIDPKYIVLEITESASIEERQVLLENMGKLRSIGVRFALDDFGTGQSNLNYIVDMPIDIVKFDRSMTNAYFDDGKGKPVMDAAMGMIQKLELEIVSEGIEKKEQFQELERLGIDFIQGFYFSKPRESEEFIRFINENK